MTSIAETLRAIEARAERAIVQELRLMTQNILTMRTVLVLEDRRHADALSLKLDRLAQNQMMAPMRTTETPAFLLPDLRLEEIQALEPVAYKVFFYDRECSDLEDVITLDAFDAGVQWLLTAVGKRVKMAVKRGFQLSGGQIECQQWSET